MRVIAFIEDEDVIKKILKHLGLWEVKRKPLPRANAPPVDVFPAYDDQPGPCADDPPSVWILRRDKLYPRSAVPHRLVRRSSKNDLSGRSRRRSLKTEAYF